LAETASAEVTLRVRYAETDAMGVVYHANYLIWFEVARGELFRQCGTDYTHWEKKGYYLPVTEISARYLAPARYGDDIVVRAWLDSFRSRQLVLAYEARDRQTGQLLATGKTVHVCVNCQGRAVPIPADMRALFEGSPEHG